VALLLVAAPAAAAVSWRDAPDYLALFAPVNHRPDYRIDVTSANLDQVLADVRDDPALVQASGAWEARGESAQDAFGTAGPFNKWLLTQAYGSRQARVARGTRTDRGRVVEAWTLISPYPSTDLRTLHSGTMRLILNVAP
jgi:hypothetical protein